jgi:hypothetical protein
MNWLFFGVGPSSKRINANIEKIRKRADLRLSELVPWGLEDLELFSFNQKGKVLKKRLGRSVEGVISSIFHESMVYYHFKKYTVSKINGILYLRTARYEIVYRIRPKESQVFVNDNYFATLTKEGILYVRSRRKNIRGQVIDISNLRKEIILHDMVAGYVVFPEQQASVNPRAFEISDKLEDKDILHFMVLGIFEVVKYLIARDRQ